MPPPSLWTPQPSDRSSFRQPTRRAQHSRLSPSTRFAGGAGVGTSSAGAALKQEVQRLHRENARLLNELKARERGEASMEALQVLNAKLVRQASQLRHALHQAKQEAETALNLRDLQLLEMRKAFEEQQCVQALESAALRQELELLRAAGAAGRTLAREDDGGDGEEEEDEALLDDVDVEDDGDAGDESADDEAEEEEADDEAEEEEADDAAHRPPRSRRASGEPNGEPEPPDAAAAGLDETRRSRRRAGRSSLAVYMEATLGAPADAPAAPQWRLDGASSPLPPPPPRVTQRLQRAWAEHEGAHLEPVLRSGGFALLDAFWLVCYFEQHFARTRQPLPRRRHLPPEAFISLEGLKAAGCPYDRLPILVLSVMWLTPSHPDPKGSSLGLIARALKPLVANGQRYGVFWDVASMYGQADPEPWLSGCRNTSDEPHGADASDIGASKLEKDEQRAAQRQAVHALPTLYAHPFTTVMQITQHPEGFPESAAHSATHAQCAQIAACIQCTHSLHTTAIAARCGCACDRYGVDADGGRFMWDLPSAANVEAYDKRCWTYAESLWCAWPGKGPPLDLSRLLGVKPGAPIDRKALLRVCSASGGGGGRARGGGPSIEPPMTSHRFKLELDERKLLSKDDRPLLLELYSRAFSAFFGSVRKLDFSHAGWGDEQVGCAQGHAHTTLAARRVPSRRSRYNCALCLRAAQVLRLCEVMGASAAGFETVSSSRTLVLRLAPELESLPCRENDGKVSPFTPLVILDEHALPDGTRVGSVALSSAPSTSVGWLTLAAPDGEPTVTREEAALQKLEYLLLGDNDITDRGVAALADVLRGGGLPRCAVVVLEGNPGRPTPVLEALAERGQ